MSSRTCFNLILFLSLAGIHFENAAATESLSCVTRILTEIGSPNGIARAYAERAERHYETITRLEKEERDLREVLKLEPQADQARLTVVLKELEQERTALMELNKENHGFLNPIRSSDHLDKELLKLDATAVPLREKKFQITEEIENHQILLNHLKGAEQKKAERALRELQARLAKVEKSLAPIEEKLRVGFEETPVELRLKQVSGKNNPIGEMPLNIETADPFIYQLKDGRVRLLGSGWVDREYASFDHLMRNLGETITYTDLRYPGGEIIENAHYGLGGPVWDKSIVETPSGETLYASALSPKKYRQGGLPTDAAYTTTSTENWTRRIYAFKKKFEIAHPLTGEKKLWGSYEDFLKANPSLTYRDLKSVKPHPAWVRNERDIWGNLVPATEDWHTHSYGGKLTLGPDWKPLLDEEGHPYIEFDWVTGKHGKLGDTAVYSQKLSADGNAVGPMNRLMSTEYEVKDASGRTVKKTYPITIRSFNREIRLIEGPQTAPQLLELSDIQNLKTISPETYKNFLSRWKKFGIAEKDLKFKVTSVGAGDYPTKDYGLLVGLRPVGPKTPMSERMKSLSPIVKENVQGELDLDHLGREVGFDNRISWGPSRPLFFKFRNRWWVMFHGIDETVAPKYFNPRVWPPDSEIDKVARNVYITPADPEILPDGQISFRLLNRQ